MGLRLCLLAGRELLIFGVRVGVVTGESTGEAFGVIQNGLSTGAENVVGEGGWIVEAQAGPVEPGAFEQGAEDFPVMCGRKTCQIENGFDEGDGQEGNATAKIIGDVETAKDIHDGIGAGAEIARHQADVLGAQRIRSIVEFPGDATGQVLDFAIETDGC